MPRGRIVPMEHVDRAVLLVERYGTTVDKALLSDAINILRRVVDHTDRVAERKQCGSTGNFRLNSHHFALFVWHQLMEDRHAVRWYRVPANEYSQKIDTEGLCLCFRCNQHVR